MFISALKKQNPRLIASALKLWKSGTILPDSYIIDVGQVLSNGKKLLNCAKQYDISLYLMAKQFGRNPYLSQRLLELGFAGMVAVDYKEARHYYSHQLLVAHLGHLVQTPTAMLKQVLEQQPEVITVYSFEKVQQIAKVAAQLGKTQPLLIKVCADGDVFYPGQESGIYLSDLADFVEQVKPLTSVKIVGVTHFPCLLLDERQRTLAATHNFHSLIKAKQILEKRAIRVSQINAPSSTCINGLPLLAEMGATHAEPGHALTGTMPLNVTGDQPEAIAMLYLSEISHQFGGHSYCFGGGYYRRGNAQTALVGEDLHETALLPFADDNIDYTLPLQGHFSVGEPVIMCFRSQIFVTRSDVVLIDHHSHGEPYVIAVYDSLGNLISG
ncbi:alanine racemase [Testudinibacter sp. TR-2022]|uniref:alanine racemase n=1 Tax=Testudinibacter sp. TR-2022 TaxID=2585029 RepID=UPI001119A539|nr:alanine racemase [Testudinibacter sp. TR-2022]TNH05769.1 YhfX family PLP-dependent enzyme [Pasteurellaceae bacterium Phil11]TNH22214.1 YhfX family PLP-dependent enzyme [Testudinibacter sp. TR-2022]TNH25813.1 YhfX family PLP-dependent enzyme [Testudinibacter sp. TR-2022]